MRQLMYDAYLSYPRRFYDQHSTGQVLSRATNDLYPVRYFIGWGVVQSIQSAMMIVGVAIVLAVVNPLLAVCAGIVMPLVAVLTWRFAYVVIPISRQASRSRPTSPRRPTRASSGSRWCRPSGASRR